MISKEEFIEIAAKRYDEVARLEEEETLYDFEKRLSIIVSKIGQETMESILSNSKEPQKKKQSSH